MKIGLCSFLRPGHEHHEWLSSHDDVELVLYYPEQERELVKLHGSHHTWAASFNDILKHDIEAIVISSPDHDHYEHLIKALKKKIPILVDKPMVYKLEQAKHIQSISERDNIPLFVGYNGRLFDIHDKAKEILNKMPEGDIYGINCRIYAPHARNIEYTDKLFFTLGCHYIDCMNWLFNKKISCQQSSIFTRKGKENSGNFTLIIDDNIPVFVSFEVNASCFPEIAESNMSIFTKEGTLILGRNDMKYISSQKKPIQEYYEDIKKNNVSDEFLKAIRGEEHKLCTLPQELTNIALLEEIYDKSIFKGL